MTDRRPTGPRSMGDLLARQRTRDDTLAELRHHDLLGHRNRGWGRALRDGA